MKNILLVVAFLTIVSLSSNASARDTIATASAAPAAAHLIGNQYVCPLGWTLISVPTLVQYYEIRNQVVCTAFGCYATPVYVLRRRVIPANYCVALQGD